MRPFEIRQLKVSKEQYYARLGFSKTTEAVRIKKAPQEQHSFQHSETTPRSTN
jgi:hypothetical protein